MSGRTSRLSTSTTLLGIALTGSLLLLAACAARETLPPALAAGSLSRSDAEAAEAAYARGLEAFRAGRYEAALEPLDTVVERYPASRIAGIALYWRARTHYQIGNDAPAAEDLARYLALAPDVPNHEHAALLLANSRYNLTDFSGALDAALRIDRAGPERLDDFLGLSRDLMRHMPRPAVEALAKRNPPRNWLAPFYLQAARWARMVGDSTRARTLARTVIDFPGLPATVLEEARALAGGADPVAARPRLGFIAPTEGRFAEVTEQVRQGVEMALDDINAERTAPIELVVRPTADDPDSTAIEIRSLARGERVMAILGPLTSEFALPAGRTAGEEGVPLVSPTATDARLQGIAPDVLTVNALDGALGHTIGTYAVRNLERRRFAILHVDDAYGRVQADAFAAAVSSEGARVVATLSYPPGKSQFTDELRGIVRGGADAVFVATKNPTEALRILNQIAFYELQGLLPLGTDAWNDEEFLEQGRRFVRGYFADTFSRDPQVTRWRSFSDRYAERYGSDPTNLIPAWGYDAARLAIEYMGGRRETGAEAAYRGASALFRFEPEGVRRAVVVHRIERGGEPVAIDW